MDLRRKVLTAIDRGETEASVAARFQIASRTVRYLKQRRRRIGFAIAGRFVESRQLIFLDESGAQSNMTRLYGRSPIGTRCVDRVRTAIGRSPRCSVLSA